METLNSFKGYNQMNPSSSSSSSSDLAFRRKTRRRIIVITLSSLLLLLLLLTTLTTLLSLNPKTPSQTPNSPLSNSLKSLCSLTLYPTSCYTSLSSAPSSDPLTLFNLSLSAASLALSSLPRFLSSLPLPPSDTRLRAAILDCQYLIADALDRFHDSISTNTIADLRTWISAAIADQETCLDGFEGTKGEFRQKLESAMENSTRLASNCLAIVSLVLEKLNFDRGRRLGELPEWVTEGQLVEGEEVANVTVAGDGTGTVRSVGEAVGMAPERDWRAFVIRVRAGEYREVVVVGKDKWNVVIVGEGMEKTVIVGDKNFVDGTPTFSTATFGEFDVFVC